MVVCSILLVWCLFCLCCGGRLAVCLVACAVDWGFCIVSFVIGNVCRLVCFGLVGLDLGCVIGFRLFT